MKYLDFISNSGTDDNMSTNPEANQEAQEPWNELKMQRTKWYDLFDADDRIELLRGIWGVMSHLMRVTE